MEELPLGPLADLQRRVGALEEARDEDVRELIEAVDELVDQVKALIETVYENDS